MLRRLYCDVSSPLLGCWLWRSVLVYLKYNELIWPGVRIFDGQRDGLLYGRERSVNRKLVKCK